MPEDPRVDFRESVEAPPPEWDPDWLDFIIKLRALIATVGAPPAEFVLQLEASLARVITGDRFRAVCELVVDERKEILANVSRLQDAASRALGTPIAVVGPVEPDQYHPFEGAPGETLCKRCELPRSRHLR